MKKMFVLFIVLVCFVLGLGCSSYEIREETPYDHAAFEKLAWEKVSIGKNDKGEEEVAPYIPLSDMDLTFVRPHVVKSVIKLQNGKECIPFKNEKGKLVPFTEKDEVKFRYLLIYSAEKEKRGNRYVLAVMVKSKTMPNGAIYFDLPQKFWKENRQDRINPVVEVTVKDKDGKDKKVLRCVLLVPPVVEKDKKVEGTGNFYHYQEGKEAPDGKDVGYFSTGKYQRDGKWYQLRMRIHKQDAIDGGGTFQVAEFEVSAPEKDPDPVPAKTPDTKP